ncbi:hypothetical protein ACCO45_011663 [Purpureocillium lilacinum]|uniref:Uncharacterized protein n=1 Tax=Purpureocillium lilacinum TaxID=33203 RepID=A0ACC4DBH5_PURLI
MAATRESQDRNELFQKLKPYEKLAEYIFFPLYHIFRQMDQYPMLLVEKCVKCLHILITFGWKSKISSKLAQQILSLLVFIIDGVPGSQATREVPEETILETFRAQTALFNTAATSLDAVSGLADQESIPILGHAITVMLQGVTDGANPQIQSEALRSLQGVYSALKEQEALASFLPGIVSSLTKVLSTPNRYKTHVLSTCLETVQLVLTKVLGDLRTRSILAQEQGQSADERDDKGKVLTPAWLQATTSQAKLALSTVVKLRTQDALKVREALERLCITLLDECHTTLANCTNILIETAIILDSGDDTILAQQTTLRYLANIYPELGEVIKTTVYNWMSSLPRIMQVSDDDSRVTAVHNLSKGIGLLQSLGVESGTLEDSITASLKDKNLMESVRESSGADQLAAMWLCYELIKASNASSAEAEAFLDLSSFVEPSSDDPEAVFHDLYTFSVQVLDSHTESNDGDWRLEALSMEVTAYAAHRSGISFRPELIDVLFPVATFLGSDNQNLREHAIATLNSIATSSQYSSVSDLIVDNVDYMVNSVALRLNTLDVSPASMQVLLMMIRLAGARLIPFMDDVVDSIFAALENYHGYTFFVESLFSVLKEVVDQASGTEQRLLTETELLAGDEDSFLPLVNAVWPVVVGRLYDSETFVTIEACHALSGLCKAAGDFLSSRFRTEWGDGLRDWCRKAKERATTGAQRARVSNSSTVSAQGRGEGILIPIRSGDGPGVNESVLEIRSKTSGSLGQHASPARVWEAVVQLLAAIVSYVSIDSQMFDDILDLLSDVMERDRDVMDALETINADAVWLARYERGYIAPMPTPKVDGFEFEEMMQMPRR